MHLEDDGLSNLQLGFPILSSSGGAQAETTAQEEPDVDQVHNWPACNCSLLDSHLHRLQHQKAELTKSPHEFGLEVTLLPGYPNVYQNPGGPVEVPRISFLKTVLQFFSKMISNR